MTEIGILLGYAGTWYFFCNLCEKRLRSPSYTIFHIYKEQFPEGMGQGCHTDGCCQKLLEGPQIFEHYHDLTKFINDPFFSQKLFGQEIENGSRRSR
jgi:hypothetical protein